MDDQNISTEQNLERRLNELESIVGLLEDGSISINEAIAKYSEGMKLALDCRRDLNLLSRQVAEAREEALEAFSRLDKEQKQEQEEWQARSQQRQAQAQVRAPMLNHAPFNPSGAAMGQANNIPQGIGLGGHGPMGLSGPVGTPVPPQMGAGYGQNQGPMGQHSTPMMQGSLAGQMNQAQGGLMQGGPNSGGVSPASNQNEQPNNGHIPVPSDSDVPF